MLESRFAVGTALPGGPPHRSVREELPHTAPIPALFGTFPGTMPMSDFPAAYTLGLRPQAFPDRPQGHKSLGNRWDLPVLGLALSHPLLNAGSSRRFLPGTAGRSDQRFIRGVESAPLRMNRFHGHYVLSETTDHQCVCFRHPRRTPPRSDGTSLVTMSIPVLLPAPYRLISIAKTSDTGH